MSTTGWTLTGVQNTDITKPTRKLPSTAWRKGAPSPNPAGRPPGVPALATALRDAVEARKDDIVKTLLDKAVSGNPDALRLVAERFAPAMRATFAPTEIPGLKQAQNLTERVQAVQNALADGLVSADHAAAILAGLRDAEVAMQVEGLRLELERLRAELVVEVDE